MGRSYGTPSPMRGAYLLTPSTPTNGFGLLTPTSSGPVGDDNALCDATLTPGADAPSFEIAQEQSDEALWGARRSSRLAKKDNFEVVVASKSSKIQNNVAAGPLVSPPLTSFGEDAIVHLPPDASPVVLSLDWQLQYPPGGSTHPSYAYPQQDPRLFFNPTMVPIVDGLPNVFALAPLMLPIGWKHVSWSGFLPIVFDPYHQGFKLTPIGALPLTCEEVQQGGLAKFVPGGERHPEAGLLPDASAFSDGSDEEKYNFDGVDWILPWAEGKRFERRSSMESVQYSITPSKRAREPSTLVDTTPSFYWEARDCPDGIVDLEDAWRWLGQKDTDPSTPFIPSPTKTWKGTGIYLTTRRIKSPIAILMGLAIRDTIEAPDDPLASYLLKQDTRKFCPFKSIATPDYVNIALLGDVEFTLMEMLSYFPNHYMWPEGAERLSRSGTSASASDIANIINMVRQLSGDAAQNDSTIARRMKAAMAKISSVESESGNDCITVAREELDSDNITVSRNKLSTDNITVSRDAPDSDNSDIGIHSYSAQPWTYDAPDLVDYPIIGLTHGLTNLPSDADAGPITQLIIWCREKGRYDLLLSQVSAVLQEAGLSSMIGPGKSGCPDKEIAGRHAAALRKDRARVLKVKKELEKAEEAADKKEKKGKRVKSE